MSHSKYAHLRYNILDHCFANKRFNFVALKQYVNEKIAEYYPGEGITNQNERRGCKHAAVVSVKLCSLIASLCCTFASIKNSLFI